MRVIAGEKGGRRLLAPPGRGTRPTSDRVREAAFSMLESLDVVEGADVWDIFAGSGAMGIEALSRGASHVTFVEQARTALSALRANLAGLGYGPERASVVAADVLSWVSARSRAVVTGGSLREASVERPARADLLTVAGDLSVDLVTADPPYAWQGWDVLLSQLAPLGPLVLAETGDELVLPGGWQALRAKRYGGTVVTLACLRARRSRATMVMTARRDDAGRAGGAQEAGHRRTGEK
jgi:16S rRNA (guanine966-N2)-methyltransferase